MIFQVLTPRLQFRLFTEEDAPLILQLNEDPEVVKFTLDPINSLQQAEQVLKQSILPQYHLYSLGRYAVELRSTGDFIGWCGLKYRKELDEVDLGYRYMKKYWGQGYAREAAQAMLDYGFEEKQLQRIVGRAMPQNIASWMILEKIGMTYIGEQIVDDHPAKTYEKII